MTKLLKPTRAWAVVDADDGQITINSKWSKADARRWMVPAWDSYVIPVLITEIPTPTKKKKKRGGK